jgi:hypothetical protein
LIVYRFLAWPRVLSRLGGPAGPQGAHAKNDRRGNGFRGKVPADNGFIGGQRRGYSAASDVFDGYIVAGCVGLHVGLGWGRGG